MSDQLAASLSKFTPDSSGFDRDALLFAAGRASARPNRRWQALAAVLAMSQLLSIGLFLHQASRPNISPRPSPLPIANSRPAYPDKPTTAPIPNLWILREHVLTTEGDLPNLPSVPDSLTQQPPLHAFTVVPPSLLD